MNNTVLKNKEEFKKILANYKPSQEALDSIDHLHVVLLAGPTSAGRNTIIHKLTDGGGYDFFVSDTTRPMRQKDGKLIEEEGNPYYFKTEDQMLQQLQQGKMMEAALIHNQQVSGTSIREFNRIMHEGKTAISEIEPQGVATYMSLRPSTIAIFVIPPDFNTWLQRITDRSHMHDQELKSRLQSAVKEFQAALNNDYYHIVINDDVDKVTNEIDLIAKSDSPPNRPVKKLELIQKLVTDTSEKISNL